MSIFQDQSLLNAFKRAASSYPSLSSHVLTVEVLDWVQTSGGDYQPILQKVTMSELAYLPVPLLRIIYSPLDLPSSVSAGGFLGLFDHYNIPSAFLAGRLRSVTHSFGALNNINNYNCAWFHYLCKNITITRDSHDRAWISDPRPGASQLQHGDSTWIRSGYFLRWAVDSNHNPEVTLICFEASVSLKERLQQIPPSSISSSIIPDPYSLFAIILEELSLQMENTVWDVMDVFRQIEFNTLAMARNRESFTGLHNVSKHTLFLQEGAEAMLLTLKSLSRHHERFLEMAPDSDRLAAERAQGMLIHAETQFQSISLRLKSLERRIQNIIALSFHLVTQDGNRIMQADSNSMETIAVVTLVFLPLSTVSTVFGSQFFNYDSSTVHVSRSFWIFWLISIPLTLMVLLFWRVSIKGIPLSRVCNELRRIRGVKVDTLRDTIGQKGFRNT